MISTYVKTNQLFDLIEQKNASGTLVNEIQTGTAYWSQGLYRLFGLVESDVPPTSKFVESHVHPLDLAKFRCGAIELSTPFELPDETEFRIIRQNGTLRWIARQSEALFDQDGRANVIISFFSDVTAKKVAAAQSSQTELHEALLTTTLKNITWTIDASGKKPASPLWCEMTGQSASQAAGLGWLDVLHPDDRRSTHAALTSALETRSVYLANYRLRCADDQYRWYLARMAPVFNSDGRLREWLGAGLDVDELRQLGGPSQSAIGGNCVKSLTGAHIRAARGALNWSVRDLADATGLTSAVVRGVEDLRAPSEVTDKLSAIVIALNRAGIRFELKSSGCVGVFFE